MSKLIAEKGIPIPERNGHRAVKQIFENLEVGDSVFDEGAANSNNLSSGGSKYIGKGNYALRKVDGGYRLWRIK